jgi:hypothetical protein
MRFDPALAAQGAFHAAEATCAPVQEALCETRSTKVQCDQL